MNGPVPVKTVSFFRPVVVGFAARRPVPARRPAKGGPQAVCSGRGYPLSSGPSTPWGSTSMGRNDRPVRPSAGSRRVRGQRSVRQAVDPPSDGPDLPAGHGGNSVPPSPTHPVSGPLQGGLRTALEPGHESGRRVSRLDAEQQVEAIGERANADRLGIESPAQRDDMALDDRGRFGGDQRDAAQGRPDEVTVQAVRGPSGSEVDPVHATYLAPPLIDGSTLVRRGPRGGLCSCSSIIPVHRGGPA